MRPDHVVVTVNRIGGSFSAPAGSDGGSGIAGGASEVREGRTGGRKAAISSAGSLRTVMAAPASTPAVRMAATGAMSFMVLSCDGLKKARITPIRAIRVFD